MKKGLVLLIFALTILILISSLFWLYEARIFVGRASVVQDISLDNSYLFVSPLRAQAGKGEKIRATVFVLDNRGIGVSGKRVRIIGDAGLTVEGIQTNTDGFGKAVFDVSSVQKGDYYLEVRVDERKLPQKAHLMYY